MLFKSPISHSVLACSTLALSSLVSGCKGNVSEEPKPFTAVVTKQEGLTSIDLGKYTIKSVRMATTLGDTYIVAGSFEGTVIGVAKGGKVAWVNELSGFMNHDIWCADITGDGIDEILAANADGNIYCMNSNGDLKWKYRANDAPMYTVSVIHKDKTPFVVCGGFDKNIRYLDAAGKVVETIASSTYSEEKPWGKGEKHIPTQMEHTADFIRPVKQKDGTEILCVVGHIAQNTTGSMYQFKPLEKAPYKITKLKAPRAIGDFKVHDFDGDGSEEILMGSTGMLPDSAVVKFDPVSGSQELIDVRNMRKGIDGFGYRVVQPEVIADGDSYQYFVLFGSRVILVKPDMDLKSAEILTGRDSFNDMCKDPATGHIILASAQSGGSCIHILDTSNPAWKQTYSSFTPPGKFQTILDNTAKARAELKTFTRPDYEREPLPVYLMSESFPTPLSKSVAAEISKNYKSPIFLGGSHSGSAENFDRSFMQSEKYKERRDRRRKYTQTQEQALAGIIPEFEGNLGIAYWGGHGNDPNYYQLSTTQKVMDAAKGKKTVVIFPEIQDPTKDFEWLMDYLVYPLAKHAQGRNANLYIRSKYNFWHGDAYLPAWKRLMSGEFHDVFVPALEETSCKAMEQSVAARHGIWASGAVDSWGARCARDNTSFDRSREHSHQMLPNHFLRQMVYNISTGAQFIDNFNVDQDYMSFLWELIAKGALYVPKREEIVSYSPVHLGMKTPDEDFIHEGSSAHWTVFYDEEKEKANPMAFGRMNGTWKGAPVTEWDFSRYAANVKDRRLNFLPPYENGLVMIAPPQDGVFADKDAPRGSMASHMHPLYKNILKEYITDGKNYFSADGKQTFAPDEYYKTIEAEIKASAKKLPLTVTGEVAWVAAQTSPNHLRLTVIDSGYLNPNKRSAKVSFHSVKPAKITDVLTGEEIKITDPASVTIDVPLGLFRFIDIELSGNL